MAKIPLRSYNREIEGMIDQGLSDQAIIHCRHILKYYPKHIDTYRLLGKAFLETQRYTEAADVLQRVLSTVPDDFISQIGLSIIREDEGNLDAAIWHMEKAFEAQPSNIAVQDELRRLYGRRDGVEPPKIRLTRGALVRMYSRGELFQQAIAEIRVALAEDPQRIDLEVILARMYFLSGQPVPATEVCSRLVNKLPYCFEANRILAEILPNTSRAEDAKTYQQRIYAMDPYLAFMSPGAISPLEVPENAVSLDQLEYQPGDETTELPDWTKTVGVEWTEENAALPDWFTAIKPEEESGEPIQPFALDIEETSSPEEELTIPETTLTEESIIQVEEETEVPDWMREAGWEAHEQKDIEAEKGFTFPEEEITPGEIPDWLQSIAPPETSALADESGEEPEDQWLESILPEDSFATGVEEELASGSFEDSTLAEEPGAQEEIQEALQSASLDDQQESLDLSTEEISGLAPLPDESEEAPQWLSDIPAKESGGEEDSGPEWLSAVSSLEDQPVVMADENESSQEPILDEGIPELPENDEQLLPEEGFLSSTEDSPQPAELDEAMSWLEGLAARQGADADTLLTQPEERSETPPAWLQELSQSTSDAPETGETVVEQGSDLDAGPETEQEEILSAEEPLSVEESPLAKEISQEDLPEWMQTLEEQPLAEEPAIEQEQSVPTEESPIGEEPAVPEEISEGGLPEWIQTLEEQPNVEEQATMEEEIVPTEELLTSEETAVFEGISKEDFPEWMQSLEEEVQESSVPDEAAFDTEPISEEVIADQVDLPDWLEDGSENVETAPSIIESIPEEDLPEWLKESLEEQDGIATVPEDDLSTEQIESQPITEPETSPMVAPDTETMDADAAFAWLESLAARQGAEEETLLVPPEERQEAPPVWVEQESEELSTISEFEEEIPPFEPSFELEETELNQSDIGLLEGSGADIITDDTTSEVVAAQVSPEEELPDWLEGLDQELPGPALDEQDQIALVQPEQSIFEEDVAVEDQPEFEHLHMASIGRCLPAQRSGSGCA
jgi:tetratricopeptide (TPR) repeat protein